MDYYSVKEIAKKVGVHPNTVRNWIESGELKAYKLGRVLRIKKEDFEDFAKETDGKEENKEGK